MRIAYDHKIFNWQEYGGISRYFWKLAVNIANINNVDVGIVSPVYINNYLVNTSNHLQILGQKMPAIGRARFIYRAINQLSAPSMMARFQPDLVHETYYSTNRLAPAGIKVALTVFDMIHEYFPECYSARDPTSRAKAIAVNRADHIICISEQTRKDLIDVLRVDPAKITVIYLGFSLTKPVGDKAQKDDRPYLLYVGERRGYKNFETLLRAYAANRVLQRDYDLTVFGGGPLTVKEQWLIKHLDISFDRVRQVGGDDRILAGLYQKAAVFVYPSLYEGFGLPPLEAMSFDCPVVCSNTSSIPEVVGNAAELFDPRSVDALQETIERVLNNMTLRQTLIVRGRERIKLFSWERCAEQTLDVYRRILS